jgi:eukaryotic-like serine/threonine-protein kinase
MRQIGPYQILDLLGKGGMGEVYLAEDLRLGRKVALKLLPPELTNNEQLVLRFQQEARTASALNHPNILTIFDIGEVESTHFIATEFVKGKTLRHHMTAMAIDLQEILDITIQVASALGAAHEVGVVHRDVKPENIMVRHDGIVKVLDFGIAKLTQRIMTGGRSEMGLLPLVNTEPGMVIGTPKYMSPEQVRGFDVDERSDIFSLGVVLYEMIAGRVPFEGETASDIIASILQKEPQQIAHPTNALPAGLQQIIDKTLCKGREERYQTMSDLISDLRSQEKATGIDRRSFLPMSSGHTPVIGITTEKSISSEAEDSPSRSKGLNTAHAKSGTEPLVSRIKQHKRGAATILALGLAAVAVVAYFSYFAPSSKAAIDSVVILPFFNASDDPNIEYLSDGISESLINNLSRLPQLKVIARSSSFKYKGQEVDPQEVARTLGVRAVVIGRVVQRGDQLQISVELDDTRDKTQMWGEQYNRKAADLLAVQSEISQQIAEKLRLRLTNAEQQQLINEAKANPLAYELVLKGRFYGGKDTREGLEKYVDYCNQAIKVDPNYALAFAGLADAYRSMGENGVRDPKEAMANAEEAASHAVKLDDTEAEAHKVLAQIKQDRWDWPGAAREFKHALELNPNFAAAHALFALYLSGMGQHAEAIAEMKRAQELDPIHIGVNGNEGPMLYNARQYDQAIAQFKKALELDRNVPTVHAYLGYAYAMKEMYAAAIAEYKEVIRLRGGEDSSTQIYLGYALAMSGQRNQALAILKQLQSDQTGNVSPAELAILYAGLGEKDQALASLERAYAEHDLQLQFLKVEPHYDSLHSDPRFTELVRKVGLTP